MYFVYVEYENGDWMELFGSRDYITGMFEWFCTIPENTTHLVMGNL